MARTKSKTELFGKHPLAKSIEPVIEKWWVSVLMLREGFDVKNVCVLVVLRRSDSDLLTEQVIGRGIRQMFPEPEYRPEKIENYQKIKNKEPLINSYDLDMSWPVSFAYKTEEEINFSYFNVSELPFFGKPFEEIIQTRILITDFHPDTKYRREWELEESNFSYSVEAYVKLNQYVHQFSIPYINNMGHLVPYYPDFLVKTRDGMLIIETKSTKDAANDIDTKIKAIAASGICSKISMVKNIPETNQPRIWNYVLLPQNILDEMEGSGLQSLIERCEANLALLKMRKE